MAKQITITLPDRLNERFQKIKNNLQVSKICQNALESAIKIEEIKNSDIPEFKKFSQKIKEELKVEAQKYREIGYKEGQKYAMTFSYQNFQDIFNARSGQSLADFGDTIWGGLCIGPTTIEELRDRFDGDFYQSSSYLEGWVEAVYDVWSKLKKELKDEFPHL